MSPVTLSSSPKTVTVLTKPKGCVMCNATHRALAKTDVIYTEKDATQDANRQIGLDLGYMEAPVVLVHQDGVLIHSWSGFNYDEIQALKNDPLVERKAPVEVRELIAA